MTYNRVYWGHHDTCRKQTHTYRTQRCFNAFHVHKSTGGVYKPQDVKYRRWGVQAIGVNQWWAYGLQTKDRKAEAQQNNQQERENQEDKVSVLAFLAEMAKQLKSELGMFSFGLVALLCAAATELAMPHFTAATIFSVSKSDPTKFIRCVKILLWLAAAYSISAAARGMAFGLLNQKFVYKLRTELFRNLVNQDVSFHDQAEVGILTSRLTSDCSTMSRILGMNINLIIRNSFKAIGGALYLWYLSPVFFATTASALCFILLINIAYGSYHRKASSTEQEQIAYSNQIAQEVLTLIRTVKIFGTENKEKQRYVVSLDHLMAIGMRQIAAYGLFLTSASFLVNVTNCLCLLIGGYQAMRGELTGQQLTSFLFYTDFVITSALATSEQFANIQAAVGSSERVFQLLKSKPKDRSSGKLQIQNFQGCIDFVNVSFKYPYQGDSLTLKNLNFSLKPGTVTALVGPSGGGKSTLVAILQSLYQATSGVVLADGVPLDNLDRNWFREQIGYVEQEPKLFELPIKENIAYGSKAVQEHDIKRAAVESNSSGFIATLPQMYETWVGNTSLSGGQRQRIALARAMIRKPRIVILDEATSALDAESEFQVQKALNRAFMHRDKSVLVIAHKLSTVTNADNILVLKDGRIVEEGKHYDLMALKGVYANLASKQGVVDLAPHCDPPVKSVDMSLEEESTSEDEIKLKTEQTVPTRRL